MVSSELKQLVEFALGKKIRRIVKDGIEIEFSTMAFAPEPVPGRVVSKEELERLAEEERERIMYWSTD